ncbi:MAG TPA: HD-GYP domain-containing protein [Actinomycetota bacterium]|nr:HD-GYP domain-containing protein [Actinomycetota bacterium]
MTVWDERRKEPQVDLGDQTQLEAYARDLRVSFAAEKHRSHELAQALADIKQNYLATVRALAIAVEAKDAYTAGHLRRVTSLGLLMLKQLDPELHSNPQFEYGFLLHDIGKMGVPDSILGKPGPLTEAEWKVMRSHPIIGRRILDEIPFLVEAKQIVLSHHERWDGGGYPYGLAGEEIPLGARLFSVADTFDAMTTDRPYRKATSIREAVEEIKRGSGTQFWPKAVEAFMSLPHHDLLSESSETAGSS